MTDTILIAIVSMVIGLLIEFFVIKLAIISALDKKLNKNTSSNDDILVIQTKILVEIAKNNNVGQDKIDEIFGFKKTN